MKLIRADYIFIFALLCFMVAHASTNFMITRLTEQAEEAGMVENARQLALTYEANPIAKWIFGLRNFKAIYSYVVVPSILTGLYWMIRRKYFQYYDILEAYAVSFFCFGFLNAMNDVSIMLGMLA